MTWSPERRLIYITEQAMLPLPERDCTTCLGNGEIPVGGTVIPKEYRPRYTSVSKCVACEGTGSYLKQLSRERR